MMSCIQASIVKPFIINGRKDHGSSASGHCSRQCHIAIPSRRSLGSSLQLSAKEVMCQKASSFLKLPCLPVQKYRQLAPVGLFGGKAKSESEGEGSAWKSLEKAMGSFSKEPSVEDLLRKQIEKQEFYGGGNTGGKPPPGGGGGGGGASGGSEDEGFAGILDETLQVVLATLGFIFLYVYIITGEELTRLGKDYLKFLFSGNKSVRLRRAMYHWGRVYKNMTEKKEEDPYWLERAIVSTPTWWDSPEKYKSLWKSYFAPQNEEPSEAEASPYGEEDSGASLYEEDSGASQYQEGEEAPRASRYEEDNGYGEEDF